MQRLGSAKNKTKFGYKVGGGGGGGGNLELCSEQAPCPGLVPRHLHRRGL